MNKKYIQPKITFVKIRTSGMLANSPEIPGQGNSGETVDDEDGVMSKSYQGGANSLLWEED